MNIVDDLLAEQGRIASILSQLDSRGWATPSRCAGWTIRDVVLHLAQSEEAAAVTVRLPVNTRDRAVVARGVDTAAERAVEAERSAP